eukprot:gene5012-15254_t
MNSGLRDDISGLAFGGDIIQDAPEPTFEGSIEFSA